MAVWYAGSDQYALVPVWATGAKIVGQFCRQVSPTAGNARAFRCTTAGSSGGSEPSWSLGNNNTTNDGTAVWTCVTGQSTWGWSSPFQRLTDCMQGPFNAGDRIYVSKFHNYTYSSSASWSSVGTSTESTFIVVDPAGSVPPVEADVSAGAIEIATSTYSPDGSFYCVGLTMKGTNINIAPGADGAETFEDCDFELTGAGSGSIVLGWGSGGSPSGTVWRNVNVKFGATSQGLAHGGPFEWYGGSVDGSGSIPTNLFKATGSGWALNYVDGVDLSALGATAIVAASSTPDVHTFANCKLPASYVLFAAPSVYGGARVDMIISDDGSANYKHERHWFEGDLTTETTIVKSSGSSDGTTAFSWKVVTTSKATYGHPFRCFTRSVWNDDVGVLKTLELEVLNDGTTLKDIDIGVIVEYLGDAASPTASFVSSVPNVLATGTNLTTSSASWTTSGIASPVKQKFSVTFTPQMAGMIRYTVVCLKPSKTFYVNAKADVS